MLLSHLSVFGPIRDVSKERKLSNEFVATRYVQEMLELLRKMMLTGLVSVVAPGSLIQIGVAIIFCVLTLVAGAPPAQPTPQQT